MSSKLQAWFSTIRPKTLLLAFASILTGQALAFWYNQQNFNLIIAVFAIITAFSLQILSNLANDYGDFQKGADTSERVGPKRGIQNGLIGAPELKKGLKACIFACVVFGAILLYVAFSSLENVLVFILLGILAIIASITYTVGNKAYGYLGLGDLSVLIFFGILGVLGSFYLQTKVIDLDILLPAIGTGLLASAVLNVNNIRDLDQDKLVGKNTLAVRLGHKKSRFYHFILILLALLCFGQFANSNFIHHENTLFLLVAFPLMKHVSQVFNTQTAKEMAPKLGHMVLLALLTNFLFSVAIVLDKF